VVEGRIRMSGEIIRDESEAEVIFREQNELRAKYPKVGASESFRGLIGLWQTHHEFLDGRRMVRVWMPMDARWPTLAPVETWEEYVQVAGYGFGSVLTENDARLQYGWRPWGVPAKPVVSIEGRVREQVEEFRVQSAAKRIVQAEMNPVEPLELKSVADLLNAPKPEWWVEDLLPKDAVIIVGGDGGVGKSALLVELAARLSTGTPFLGSRATRRARTLYAVGEGMSGYGERFRSVSAAHGLDADQVRLITTGVNMASVKSMDQVRSLVTDSNVDLVVFDTLSSLSTLESENDAAEVGRLLNAAKHVREGNPGCSVIIVHHTNKASGGLRGSSVIRDNADAVWMLRGDSDAFFLSTKSKHGGKMKDGEALEIHGLSLVQSGTSVVVEHAGPTVESSAARQRVPAVALKLAAGAKYTTAELRELIRGDGDAMSDATAKRTITELIAAGKILSIGRGQYEAT
jgi:hypothetical protein